MEKERLKTILYKLGNKNYGYLAILTGSNNSISSTYIEFYKNAKKTEPPKTLSFPVRLSHFYGVIRTYFLITIMIDI